MIKYTFILLGLFILLISCSSNKEDSAQKENSSETESSKPEVSEKKNQEEQIEAVVTFNTGGESYEIDNFDKRTSGISWTDNGALVNLKTIDREMSFILTLSELDISEPRPMKLTLTPGKLIFQGVFGDMHASNTQFIEGSATIDQLEKGSLDFEMSFDGLAMHTDIVKKKKDTLNIEGKIKAKFEKEIDVTSK